MKHYYYSAIILVSVKGHGIERLSIIAITYKLQDQHTLYICEDISNTASIVHFEFISHKRLYVHMIVHDSTLTYRVCVDAIHQLKLQMNWLL